MVALSPGFTEFVFALIVNEELSDFWDLISKLAKTYCKLYQKKKKIKMIIGKF